MNPLFKAGLLTLMLATVSSQAHALRCGTKLVTLGDRKHEVVRICGDPSYTDSFDKPIVAYGYSGYHPQTTQRVDVWTYNFGQNRFMQELIFEGGVLRRINQLGYGYREN